MALEIIGSSGGLITAKVSGKLKKSEVDQGQKAAIDVMRTGAKVRFLIIAEDFQGWDKEGDWGDISFQLKYDEQIEKIALVGEKEWKDLVSMFVGEGLRSAEIRYFQPGQLALARVWAAK